MSVHTLKTLIVYFHPAEPRSKSSKQSSSLPPSLKSSSMSVRLTGRSLDEDAADRASANLSDPGGGSELNRVHSGCY